MYLIVVKISILSTTIFRIYLQRDYFLVIKERIQKIHNAFVIKTAHLALIHSVAFQSSALRKKCIVKKLKNQNTSHKCVLWQSVRNK